MNTSTLGLSDHWAKLVKLTKFCLLYVYGTLRFLVLPRKHSSRSIRGTVVTSFFDPANPTKRHGVVAFLIPKELDESQLSSDIVGPMGKASQIRIGDFYLYNRDDWGFVNQQQLHFNPTFQRLQLCHPNHRILLAGVRKIGDKHPWPLNMVHHYHLVDTNSHQSNSYFN